MENGVVKDVVDTKGTMWICNDDGGATELKQCVDTSTCASNTCLEQNVYVQAQYAKLKAGSCALAVLGGYTLSVCDVDRCTKC